jgi:lysozyme
MEEGDMNRTVLKVLLVRHEKLMLKPYTDTAGKLTIGVGRNLTDDGITEAEAGVLLDNDIATAILDLRLTVLPFSTLSDNRQHALIDMMLNLGRTRFSKFDKMIAALNALDFSKAADEMLESLWAREVGDRAKELAKMVREG